MHAIALVPTFAVPVLPARGPRRYTRRSPATVPPRNRDVAVSNPDSPTPSSRARRQQLLAEGSMELLTFVQQGDELALDVLCARHLPALERWATGRLPAGARDLLETGDIVQETVVRALRGIDRFEHQRPGALLAYLRTAIMNRIRDEARRVERRPLGTELEPERHVESSPSPLEDLIGRESIELYERALETLNDADREAVVARLEMGLSFDEIAGLIGKSNANAARMTFNRALLRVAEEMRRAS